MVKRLPSSGLARLLLILLTILSILGGVSISFTASDNSLSRDGLLKELRTENIDRIREALNTIRRMRYQGELLPVLSAVWEERIKEYPDLAWNTLRKPIIRADVANVLLQAERNGKIQVNKDQMHEYLRGLVSSDDVDVVGSAIWSLEIFDDEQDVDMILAVAKKQSKRLFPTAVIALAQMCNPGSQRALNELERQVTDPELKKLLLETKQKSERFKAETHRCEKGRL